MSASEFSQNITLVIPAVQPQHVTTPLPQGVKFCSPGLRDAMKEPFFVSPKLPLNSAEARGQLHELLQYGLSFRSARDMSGVVLAEKSEEKSAEKAKAESLRDELAEIDAFAESGEFVASEKEEQIENTVEQRLLAAQKTLLLAWDMESRVAELANLKDKFSASSANMENILGISEEDELEELPGIDPKAVLKGDIEEDLGVPWQAVAAAILEFAPERARFMAVKRELIELLPEIGKDITPDEVDEETYGFALPYTDGWKLYAVKAYALLGHTRAPEGRKDLERTIEIFAAG